jgi:hypothetical protein
VVRLAITRNELLDLLAGVPDRSEQEDARDQSADALGMRKRPGLR